VSGALKECDGVKDVKVSFGASAEAKFATVTVAEDFTDTDNLIEAVKSLDPSRYGETRLKEPARQ